MSWFSGNTDSDSEGNSSATEGTTQSRTPTVWNPPICRTARLPLRPLSATSTPRPASSHRISLSLYRPETGSPSREGGDRRIHSPWRNSNVLPQCESPAALEPLAISISTLPEPSSEPVPDPNITLTSESKEETYELAEDNRMEVGPMSRPTEFKAGLPEDFSGKNDNAMRWLLAMKAYFVINKRVYTEDATTVLIFLNKLSKGRGATFSEGWYMKLANPGIPDSEKTFKKLCKAFEEAFVLKDLKDRACQTVYSLNMDQFNGDFDKYSTAFKLAQARCGVDDNSILIDALQQGVTQQLAVMMTTVALPDGQTSWKWEQWLDKAEEFYQNMV